MSRKYTEEDLATAVEFVRVLSLKALKDSDAKLAAATARCARLEGALDECIKAIKEWPSVHPEGDYLHGWVLSQAIEAREGT